MLGHNLDPEAMSTGRYVKVKRTSALSSDRLSSLPSEMKGNILSRLNVQEAVRTSILSRAWRNTWTTMPGMILCDRSFPESKFNTLVDMSLSLHNGPLHAFKISGSKSHHDVLHKWMLLLSKRSPRSVKIKLTSGPKYKIPSSLFTSNLYCLRLRNCIISLPNVFQGFKSLTVLKLDSFSSTDGDIHNLISWCPMLSDLRLTNFVGINCLNIQALKLKYLLVYGKFIDIYLDAPNLEEAMINATWFESVLGTRDGKNYLKQALGSLSDLKKLDLDGYFLMYLSEGRIIMKLPVVFNRLEIITLGICLCSENEVLTMFSLFRNAPILKELHIQNDPWREWFGPTCLWDQDEASSKELNLQMDHLVTVCFSDFGGSDQEVAFTGKLLSCATVLEEIKIDGKDNEVENAVLKKLQGQDHYGLIYMHLLLGSYMDFRITERTCLQRGDGSCMGLAAIRVRV